MGVAAQYAMQLSRLKTTIQNESNLVKRELLYEELKELEKSRVGEKEYDSVIAELEIRIRELIKLDALKNEEGRRVAEKKNRRIKVVAAKVTGMYKVVEYN